MIYAWNTKRSPNTVNVFPILLTWDHKVNHFSNNIACIWRLYHCVAHFETMACSQWIPNLLDKIRWIWVLAYFFCTFLFIYQLIQILPNYFSPTLTHTEVKEVPLRDMDFPLDFKICLRPSAFNETALKELGYGDSGHYILGKSKFNESIHIIGWGGHSSNESSLVKMRAKC